MTQAEEELRTRLKRTLEHVQDWQERVQAMNMEDLPYDLQVKLGCLQSNMISLLLQNK